MRKLVILLLIISYYLCSCISHAAKPEAAVSLSYTLADLHAMICEGQQVLQEGDIVVRLNRDPSSQFIKDFNRHDKSYSHAGIVLYENGFPYVFHIVNGEENPAEKIKKDSLFSFCNPGNNLAYGIFRYKLNEKEIRKLKNLIYQWYAKGIRFDSVFNLDTDDRMYCSEMVAKALMQATHNRILIENASLTTMQALAFSAYAHLSFGYTSKLRVISIDDLYANPLCHLIKKFSYDKHE